MYSKNLIFTDSNFKYILLELYNQNRFVSIAGCTRMAVFLCCHADPDKGRLRKHLVFFKQQQRDSSPDESQPGSE